MRKNLIYILFERNVHKASLDIEEIFQDKISDESLAVYDLDEKRVIFSNYISEDTIDEALEDAETVEIPLLEEKLKELKDGYEERWKRIKALYKRQEREREYAIYLNVKERIENGERFDDEE